MNTVFLNKAKPVARIAGLLALAALAIAFFALPFASYAMGKGCGNKTKKPNNTAASTSFTKNLPKATFLSLVQDEQPITTSPVPATDSPTASFSLITQPTTNMVVGSWIQIKNPLTGQPTFATVVNSKGVALIVDGTLVQLSGNFPAIKASSNAAGSGGMAW